MGARVSGFDGSGATPGWPGFLYWIGGYAGVLVWCPDAKRDVACSPFEECGPVWRMRMEEPAAPRQIPFIFFSLFFPQLFLHSFVGVLVMMALALVRNSGSVLENGEHGDSLRWDVESDFQCRGLECYGIPRWPAMHPNANRVSVALAENGRECRRGDVCAFHQYALLRCCWSPASTWAPSACGAILLRHLKVWGAAI